MPKKKDKLKKLKKALRGIRGGIKVKYDGDILRFRLSKAKTLSFKIDIRSLNQHGEQKDYPWLIIELNGKEIFCG